MKTRTGFVSNSSSTSFTFIFKGNDVKALCDTIWKYRDHFKLSCDFGWSNLADSVYHCNAQSVVEAIEGAFEQYKNDKYDKLEVVSIDKHIENLVGTIRNNDETIAEDKKKNEKLYSCVDIYERYNERVSEDIKQLRAAKKKGCTSVLVIGFGDGDGEVSGGDVGYCMDYKGREIHLYEKDFVVLTEQCR